MFKLIINEFSNYSPGLNCRTRINMNASSRRYLLSPAQLLLDGFLIVRLCAAYKCVGKQNVSKSR